MNSGVETTIYKNINIKIRLNADVNIISLNQVGMKTSFAGVTPNVDDSDGRTE